MRSTTKTLGVLAMVVLLVAGGAIAAAPSVDTEATDTATQSEITDGHTVEDFNASTDNISTLQYSVDSTDPGLKIVDPDSGDVIKSLTNASNADYFAKEGDDGAGTHYYNVTLSQEDFAAVPMHANENKSVTLRMVNNTTVDDPDTTNITVHLNNTDGSRAVVWAGSGAVDGDATSITADFTETETFAGLPVLSSTFDQFEASEDDVGIEDSDTTVYVVYGDDNGSTAFSDALDRKRIGSYESGDWILTHQARADGMPMRVFDSEAPDGADGTFAETTTVDGYDAHAITLSDDYDEENNVDVGTHLNDKYGIFTQFKLRTGLLLSLGFGGLGAGVLLLFGRPEV